MGKAAGTSKDKPVFLAQPPPGVPHCMPGTGMSQGPQLVLEMRFAYCHNNRLVLPQQRQALGISPSPPLLLFLYFLSFFFPSSFPCVPLYKGSLISLKQIAHSLLSHTSQSEDQALSTLLCFPHLLPGLFALLSHRPCTREKASIICTSASCHRAVSTVTANMTKLL